MTSTLTKENKGSLSNSITNFSVFGTIKKDKINHFTPPYVVRNNCQVGQWTVGDDILGNTLEIAVFSMASYYGNLGKTKGTNWLQVWFVGMPHEEKLPKNTVCVTYLKGESLTNLGQKAITVMGNDVDPGFGVWSTKFEKKTGTYGNYYTVNFDWRPRKEDEMSQLELIADFMATNPLLIDPNLPPTMVQLTEDANIEAAQQLIKLIEESKEQK